MGKLYAVFLLRPWLPMNRPALAVLVLTGVVLAPTAVSAQAFDMFPSKAAAEKRANEQMLHKALQNE